MTNHLQQIASTALLLLIGMLALRVWRRLGAERRERPGLAWRLTAVNFLIVGGYAFAHSVLAAGAAVMGDGSRLDTFVDRWATAANVGRCIASVAFGVLLIVLLSMHRRTGARVVAAAPGVLLAAALAGTLVGRLVAADSPYALASIVAVLNALTALVLMGALLVAVLNDGFDQLLWLGLLAYTLKQTMSVSLLAMLAWWDADQQVQAFRILYWLSLALSACMLGLAARRLHLAAAGRRVPGVFERLHTLRRTSTV